jgi:hypothetical protein
MNSSPLGFCEMSAPVGLESIALMQSERDEGGGSRVSELRLIFLPETLLLNNFTKGRLLFSHQR